MKRTKQKKTSSLHNHTYKDARHRVESREIDNESQKRYDNRYLIRQPLSDVHAKHLLTPIPLISDLVEEKMLIEQVLAALGKLTDYEQMLIKGRFYEEKDLRKLASEIGIHTSTVKRQIDTILRKLYKVIG